MAKKDAPLNSVLNEMHVIRLVSANLDRLPPDRRVPVLQYMAQILSAPTPTVQLALPVAAVEAVTGGTGGIV
jgi:hypothetical protein